MMSSRQFLGRRAGWLLALVAVAAVLLMACGCAAEQKATFESALPDSIPAEELADTATLGADVAPANVGEAAPGVKKKSSAKAVIDYSNTEDGYVMVDYTGVSGAELRAVVLGPTGDETVYGLVPGVWTALPLDQGDGTYEVGLYELMDGSAYEQVISQALNVTLDR